LLFNVIEQPFIITMNRWRPWYENCGFRV